MARFQLGQVVITRTACNALNQLDVLSALDRHIAADWGEIDREDWLANNAGLEANERLLSAYTDSLGTKFWIITEWDRSATTILLPEDY